MDWMVNQSTNMLIDAFRAGKSNITNPTDKFGGQMSWMSAQPGQGLTQESMMQALLASPGLTPDLLRKLLAAHQNQSQPPVVDPRAQVSGANFMRPF